MSSVAGRRKTSGAAYFLTGPLSLVARRWYRLLDDHLIAQDPLHLRRDHVDRLLRCRAGRLDRRDPLAEGVLPLREIGVRRLKGRVVEEVAGLLDETVLDPRRRRLQALP